MTIDTTAEVTPVPMAGATQGILDLGVFEWRTTGEFSLTYRNGTPQDVWLEDMQQLFRLWDGKEKLDARLRFMIGDGLVFGRTAYGEEWAQAIELAAGALGAVKEKKIGRAHV